MATYIQIGKNQETLITDQDRGRLGRSWALRVHQTQKNDTRSSLCRLYRGEVQFRVYPNRDKPWRYLALATKRYPEAGAGGLGHASPSQTQQADPREHTAAPPGL